jgi:hypothetical protein
VAFVTARIGHKSLERLRHPHAKREDDRLALNRGRGGVVGSGSGSFDVGCPLVCDQVAIGKAAIRPFFGSSKMKMRLSHAANALVVFVMAFAATSSTCAQQAVAKTSPDADLPALAAQWWQWALSIPTSVNPLEDVNGANCMVGQRGSVWFLAGAFSGGTVSRSCSVPDQVTLIFPVINQVNFNTPNVCGQGPASYSIRDLRASSAAFIAGVSKLSASVDSEAIPFKHVKSVVFEIALPIDNVFNFPCVSAGLGTVPPNVYSPAVDEGMYVVLKPLKVGRHTVHVHAENASYGLVEDITYDLTVVPAQLE